MQQVQAPLGDLGILEVFVLDATKLVTWLAIAFLHGIEPGQWWKKKPFTKVKEDDFMNV